MRPARRRSRTRPRRTRSSERRSGATALGVPRIRGWPAWPGTARRETGWPRLLGGRLLAPRLLTCVGRLGGSHLTEGYLTGWRFWRKTARKDGRRPERPGRVDRTAGFTAAV